MCFIHYACMFLLRMTKLAYAISEKNYIANHEQERVLIPVRLGEKGDRPPAIDWLLFLSFLQDFQHILNMILHL